MGSAPDRVDGLPPFICFDVVNQYAARLLELGCNHGEPTHSETSTRNHTFNKPHTVLFCQLFSFTWRKWGWEDSILSNPKSHRILGIFWWNPPDSAFSKSVAIAYTEAESNSSDQESPPM